MRFVSLTREALKRACATIPGRSSRRSPGADGLECPDLSSHSDRCIPTSSGRTPRPVSRIHHDRTLLVVIAIISPFWRALAAMRPREGQGQGQRGVLISTAPARSALAVLRLYGGTDRRIHSRTETGAELGGVTTRCWRSSLVARDRNARNIGTSTSKPTTNETTAAKAPSRAERGIGSCPVARFAIDGLQAGAIRPVHRRKVLRKRRRHLRLESALSDAGAGRDTTSCPSVGGRSGQRHRQSVKATLTWEIPYWDAKTMPQQHRYELVLADGSNRSAGIGRDWPTTVATAGKRIDGLPASAKRDGDCSVLRRTDSSLHRSHRPKRHSVHWVPRGRTDLMPFS